MKNLLITTLLLFSTTVAGGWFNQDNYYKNIAPQIQKEARQERANVEEDRCDTMMDKYEQLMYENPDDAYYEYQYYLWLEKCE